MNTLSARIKEIMAHTGLSTADVARICEVTDSAVSQWKSGDKVTGLRPKPAFLLSQKTGYSAHWIATGEGEKFVAAERRAPLTIEENDADYVTVEAGTLRVQAGVSGFSVDVENKPDKPIIFRRDWLQKRGYSPAALYAVKVAGRSMEPTLFAGDTVVLDTSATEPRDGEVYVLNCGGEVVVKRLMRRGGAWWMHSDGDQTRYPPVQCDEGCNVIGRVIHRQSETI